MGTVTLLRVTLGVTWTQLIYIYIYIYIVVNKLKNKICEKNSINYISNCLLINITCYERLSELTILLI